MTSVVITVTPKDIRPLQQVELTVIDGPSQDDLTIDAMKLVQGLPTRARQFTLEICSDGEKGTLKFYAKMAGVEQSVRSKTSRCDAEIAKIRLHVPQFGLSRVLNGITRTLTEELKVPYVTSSLFGDHWGGLIVTPYNTHSRRGLMSLDWTAHSHELNR